MPCYECEEGKWRFGETGYCQYESKSDCETANKDYYADEEHDHHFHFTKEMMEVLHSEGELEVKVEEDGREMLILFTYDSEREEEEYNPEEEEDIKDKFGKYFDKVIKDLKK
tara:strand:- start:226 stop:561 length:336 start_codon:yes stop_codon:yes gene_type:complete